MLRPFLPPNHIRLSRPVTHSHDLGLIFFRSSHSPIQERCGGVEVELELNGIAVPVCVPANVTRFGDPTPLQETRS
jgi:hypothetical protein